MGVGVRTKESLNKEVESEIGGAVLFDRHGGEMMVKWTTEDVE